MGFEATVHLNQLASTVRPLPKIAHMDLAALVLNRKKLSKEPIRFSKQNISLVCSLIC